MIFVWFGDGNDGGPFPNVWYGVSVKSNVVHVCQVSDGKRSQVFKVSDVDAIRSSGVIVCAL